MTEVRAAVGDGVGNFRIGTIYLDAPQGREVLIQVGASGVCHTEWDSLQWGRRLVLGHAGAGVVLCTGPEVTCCRAGDRVLLNWAIPCGTCFQCERGKENLCEDRGTVPDARYHENGSQQLSPDDIATTIRNTGGAGPGRFNASFSLGTMATHALVPEAAVLALPEDVPFEIGAILGCAVMTGFGSVVNTARVEAGSTVVVLGCGGVGLSTLLGAVYCKAARIIAIDVNPHRLELARQFGATETLLADHEDKGLRQAAIEIRRRTGGRGADYAFESTAVPELGPAPLAMVRSAGLAVGVSGIEQVVPIDMELFEWDKLYLNPLYGSCRPNAIFHCCLICTVAASCRWTAWSADTIHSTRWIRPLQTCAPVATRRELSSLIEPFHTVELSDPALEQDGLRLATVKSRALARRADVSFWVPPAAEPIGTLLILLHGVYGSHWVWSLKGGAHRTAQRLLHSGAIDPLVIAMPSDGLDRDGSGYLRWPADHGNKAVDLERFLLDEVPLLARLAAPALAPAAKLAFAGLSMGGYGALRLGAKYPERICAVSAHSAITTIDDLALFTEEPFSDYLPCAPREELDVLFWMRRNRDRLPPVRLDCGVDDPLLESNRRLHTAPESEGVAHSYQEFAGEHTWPYWQEHFEKTLLPVNRYSRGEPSL